jgi:glutamate dehydrogenase
VESRSGEVDVDACATASRTPSRASGVATPRTTRDLRLRAPRVEGVHLRGGKVARGGLRWSDRREDFRTEVLGLVKAQMVKNARHRAGRLQGRLRGQAPPPAATATPVLAEGVACYRTFIAACSTSPTTWSAARWCRRPTWCATTATIPTWWSPPTRARPPSPTSPTRISAEHGFWLGDAFASGGSVGYDHKGMGITARGAWESVKRHFRELGPRHPEPGLHLRRHRRHVRRRVRQRHAAVAHIRLVAAFDHRHIFLDPNPDAAKQLRRARAPVQAAALVWATTTPS